MAEDSLVQYFRDNIAKGYTQEQIITFLTQQGYGQGKDMAKDEYKQ